MTDFWSDNPDAAPSDAPPRPQSVSEVAGKIRGLLEGNLGRLWLEGEITNWSQAGSGHVYFGLRDEKALLSCVMWRSSRMKFPQRFQDGDRVEARGKISVYEPRGQMQIVVESLKPVGEGALYQRFLEIKDKLSREGLFETERKKPIPTFPDSIGVVTSPTGAAIRDVLSVLERRAPGIPIHIYPTRVQGQGAAQEIRRGVETLAKSGLCSVIIITRGGGSMEDLWEFNDEALARTIAACPVPTISAVGHEVDFTICDFVADLRAPTPSVAAEIVSENHADIQLRVRENVGRLHRVMDQRLDTTRRHLNAMMNSYALRQPERLVHDTQQNLDDLMDRLHRSVDDKRNAAKQRAEKSLAALAGHNPSLILKKGYAILRDEKGERVLTKAKDIQAGQIIQAELQDGKLEVDVRRKTP